MTEVSGETQHFAVLGHPIGHSLSPVMHNAALRSLGLDAVYLAFDVEPGRLLDVLPAMRDMGFGGVNLTVPLKEVAYEGLPALDDSARLLGAVNTVEFLEDGTLMGHNTDGYGFLRAIRAGLDASIEGRRVFVLGCGGAGRAVALTCAVHGAAELHLADIDEARARKLAGEIAQLGADCRCTVCPSDPAAWPAECVHSDLAVQATPMGMKPGDASLLGPAAFRAGQLAFDLVYMYPHTAFMRTAVEAGARAVNGLGMLLHQGARAFTIWTGIEAATDVMRAALEKEVYGDKNSD